MSKSFTITLGVATLALVLGAALLRRGPDDRGSADEMVSVQPEPSSAGPAANHSAEPAAHVHASVTPEPAVASDTNVQPPTALTKTAVALANTNLPAATHWLNTLPPGREKEAATLTVAYEAARTDPLTALTLAVALPATGERDDLLAFAISQWAAADSENATAWAAQVPDSTLRQHLLAAIAVAMAGADGITAATLAGTSLAPGSEQNRTAVAIVQRWAQTSPQAAADWVAQFPDNPTRTAATENLLVIWIREDATAAANWLDSLPAGSMRDAGTAAYAETLASCNHDSAATVQ